MIGTQMRALLWLRWRLTVNQLNRMSLVSRWIGWAVLIGGTLIAAASFFAAFTIGAIWFPTAVPTNVAFYWDAVVLVFLFSFLGGVISELQRSESLTLEKFLHLPVSPRGIFLLNFLSSSISLSTCTFFPMMLGLAAAMIYRYGASMLFVVLLIVAFFLMVTGITHQFRGWIAALMADKKRKRTLIAIGTIILVCASIMPMVVNRSIDRAMGHMNESETPGKQEQLDRLEQQFQNNEISKDQFDDGKAIIAELRQARRAEQIAIASKWARLANTVLPIGWLPQGIESWDAGHWPQALACLLGMLSIATWSLSRSYLTTLRIYRGSFSRAWTGGSPPLTPAGSQDLLPTAASTPARVESFMFRSMPGLSEHQSAVAMATLKSLGRAPEAKLAIFFPAVILAILTGSSVFGSGWGMGTKWQAVTAMGAGFFVMMGATQLIQNQFGFDRDGFRYFLLAPIRARDILIGKNAALAPLAMLMSLVAIIVLQIFKPLPFTHFLATFCQLGTVFLVACLVGNLMAIYVPLAMKSGSLKPVNLKFSAAILQMLIFILAPLGIAPSLLPLVLEFTLEWIYEIRFPFYLVGSITYLLTMIVVYRYVIEWQGNKLYQRRHKILDSVTNVNQ